MGGGIVPSYRLKDTDDSYRLKDTDDDYQLKDTDNGYRLKDTDGSYRLKDTNDIVWYVVTLRLRGRSQRRSIASRTHTHTWFCIGLSGIIGHIASDCKIGKVCYGCGSPDHIRSIGQAVLRIRKGNRSGDEKEETTRTKGRVFHMTTQEAQDTPI
uniref:Uncharacterized protein n=1 Tax=Lactuca sativa TaxID=4236 RepID=A0A9R1XVS9_LACSA|nr:hypothetical protein LSAT_V11C100047210 [Lactuca sativa]